MSKLKEKYDFRISAEKEIIISVIPRGISKVDGNQKEFIPIEYRISWTDLLGDSVNIETAKAVIEALAKAVVLAEEKEMELKEKESS